APTSVAATASMTTKALSACGILIDTRNLHTGLSNRLRSSARMIGRISEAAKYMVYNTINTKIPVRETARTRSAADRVESGSLAVGAAPLASLFLSLVIAMFLV